MPYEVWRPIEDAAFTLWAQEPESAPGILEPATRKNVLLRLWAGCVGAGKMIALNTQEGPTTAHVRANFFGDIAPILPVCPIFEAGVTYAYDWKQSFYPPQAVCFDGVPAGHVVRLRCERGPAPPD